MTAIRLVESHLVVTLGALLPANLRRRSPTNATHLARYTLLNHPQIPPTNLELGVAPHSAK